MSDKSSLSEARSRTFVNMALTRVLVHSAERDCNNFAAFNDTHVRGDTTLDDHGLEIGSTDGRHLDDTDDQKTHVQ